MTTVELAFTLPVLLLIVVGLLEVAHAMMLQHVIQDAARQGCRTAICPRSTNAAVQSTVATLLQAEGVSRATTTILVNNVAGEVSQARSSDNICVQVTIAASDASIVPGSHYVVNSLKGSFTLRLE